MKDKMFSDYLSDVKERINALSNEEKSGLINILNHSAAPVLKKIFGSKFNVVGAVTQLGLMSCDKNNWKDSEIRKNPFFCADKKSV